MTRQAISPRLAIKMRLNMPRMTPRAGELGLRRQRKKVNRAKAHAPRLTSTGRGRGAGRDCGISAALHELARNAPRSTDMAGDPGQHIGVDIWRLAYAHPVPRQYQPLCQP